jgi:hypothetical protein
MRQENNYQELNGKSGLNQEQKKDNLLDTKRYVGSNCYIARKVV